MRIGHTLERRGGGRPFRVVRICVEAVGISAFLCIPPARADPIGLQWPQPDGKGSPVFITYSYSNLLDGSLLLLSPTELRAATEEVLGLWATYAPLHFIERPDSGPVPSDDSYDSADHPQIRIGHHDRSHPAHAYHPDPSFGGLAGDVHLSTGGAWALDGSTRWHFLEVMTHELGHSLGLGHESRADSMMNESFGRRYAGLGTAFLYPTDIHDIRRIYGAGSGSVQPLESVPEPATVLLVAGGLAAAFRRSRRQRARRACASDTPVMAWRS